MFVAVNHRSGVLTIPYHEFVIEGGANVFEQGGCVSGVEIRTQLTSDGTRVKVGDDEPGCKIGHDPLPTIRRGDCENGALLRSCVRVR